MAEGKQNIALHRKRLEVRRSEMLTNLDKMDLRALEIQEEIARLKENEVKTREEIELLSRQIEQMKEE